MITITIDYDNDGLYINHAENKVSLISLRPPIKLCSVEALVVELLHVLNTSGVELRVQDGKLSTRHIERGIHHENHASMEQYKSVGR